MNRRREKSEVFIPDWLYLMIWWAQYQEATPGVHKEGSPDLFDSASGKSCARLVTPPKKACLPPTTVARLGVTAGESF
jgi:hypothetical protein